jgi:peptide deformylase
MAIRQILTAPDPRLKQKSKTVETVDDGLRRRMDDMLDTMYDAPGIGLAAVQLGVAKRVVVMDVSREGEPAAPQHFVNPEILWQSEDLATYEEGCLSVPEHYADVARPARCRVRFLDYQGETREIEAEGLMATCLQNEIDHLEGVLFVDHLSTVKRSMILRKLTKQKRLTGV